MKSILPIVRICGALLLTAFLVSCSLLNGPWRGEKKEPVAAAPVEPVVPPPVPTYKFAITPDQDLVGVVQVTTSTKEDTLSDIARRFNVGYEEMVRANPGVDPWLPGADKTIVVPIGVAQPTRPMPIGKV